MPINSSNPFSEFAANMADYQELVAGPLAAGQLAQGIVWQGKNYPGVVAPFEVHQVLVEGGLSPVSMSQVILQKAILPANLCFKSGNELQVVALGGTTYFCKVQAVEDVFTEWRLTVQDRHFKA